MHGLGADLNALDQDGYTILKYAYTSEAFNYYVDHGIDPC
jgi:hypothetical protein